MEEGFAVKPGKVSWSWAPNPFYGKNSEDPKERARYEIAVKKNKTLQRKDAQRIGRALLDPSAPFIMRGPKDIAGWPEQQVIPLPIEMTPSQQPVYEEAWTRFRNWLRLTPAKSDPKGALVETLRYRQKTSLLKAKQVVDNIEDWVEAGNQVYVSCEFIETLDQYIKYLDQKKITWVEISGRTAAEREEERLKFQRGEASVALCTVVAGISLHQEETLPDGTKASSAPRITVISDVRMNNLDTEQAAGRAHRDGQNSVLYFPYLEGTIDEKVIASYTNKTANMKSMLGSTIESAEDLERLFRVAAAKSKGTL
jgi:SNF2 family DNA or RNA helicase